MKSFGDCFEQFRVKFLASLMSPARMLFTRLVSSAFIFFTFSYSSGHQSVRQSTGLDSYLQYAMTKFQMLPLELREFCHCGNVIML